MAIAYLGLGSNLNIPKSQLLRALHYIHKLPRTHILARSAMHPTIPVGVKIQPRYLNMVIKIKTALPPLTLLRYCQTIEYKQKRIRKQHWGARTIDIDILLYDQKQMYHPHLKIPHPFLLQRDFVLIPLLEISPHVCLPNGQKMAEVIAKH
ncbi:MAG TPA: 2-amino-4-hydroxy-6-hydroxymethyldihydropteridine diphosphokinase [Legionellaceae bacterium]|nr:2-amino-4-hydroxy-6-hydroxymethyldihydropteridine diphosphokinase [Legionellaceae bacterium]